MTTVLIDSYVNSSNISDIEILETIHTDSYVNSSNISAVKVISDIYTNSLVNASTIPSIFSVSLGVLDIFVDSITNSSTLNSVSLNGSINLESISNVSSISDLNVSYPRTFSVISIRNSNGFGSIIVKQNMSATEIERPENPITRPSTNRISTFEERQAGLIGKTQYTYKDLSISFTAHPLTGQPVRVFDINSINQSLKNIILTEKYERPCSNLSFGGSIKSKLFELMDSGSKRDIETTLLETINNNEPRVMIVKIEVEMFLEEHSMQISIFYKIKMFQQTQEFSLFLERA